MDQVVDQGEAKILNYWGPNLLTQWVPKNQDTNPMGAKYVEQVKGTHEIQSTPKIPEKHAVQVVEDVGPEVIAGAPITDNI